MSREKVLNFGPGGHFTGILCEPQDHSLGAEKPLVLLTNTGVSHRVGPFRLNVELARQLAGMGYYSLRFDFSGLGDSEPSREDRTEAERTAYEAKLVMDQITKRTGIYRFIMVGLCTGADKTHIVASHDERVIGTVFIDGYAYKTLAFHILNLSLRFMDWRRAKQFFRVRWTRARHFLSRQPQPSDPYAATIASPARKKIESDLVAMAKRGVRQLHLFTISTDYIYNYSDQFWDMYPKLKAYSGSVVTERYKQVDHTLSMVGMRGLIIDRICRWVAQL